MNEGEYEYQLIDGNKVLAKGLAQLGDYTPEKQTYNTNNNGYTPYQGYDIYIMSFSGSSISQSSITFASNSDGTGYEANSGYGAYVNSNGATGFFELLSPSPSIIKK